MKNVKFTQGQWKVNSNSELTWIETNDESESKIICTMGNNDKCEANAKLIESAPELLDSAERLLIDFIFSLGQQGKNLGWSDEKIIQQIDAHPIVVKTRALIKKITQ